MCLLWICGGGVWTVDCLDERRPVAWEAITPAGSPRAVAERVSVDAPLSATDPDGEPVTLQLSVSTTGSATWVFSRAVPWVTHVRGGHGWFFPYDLVRCTHRLELPITVELRVEGQWWTGEGLVVQHDPSDRMFPHPRRTWAKLRWTGAAAEGSMWIDPDGLVDGKVTTARGIHRVSRRAP